MTTKTKAPVREGVNKAKASTLNEFLDNNNLAGSISSALDRSEVVIAAEAIVEKLQGMAEDLSQVEAKDIMPLLDSMTNSFGPQVAQNFNNMATEQIRTLITSVQGAKTALDSQIFRLKQGVESGNVSDMAMDAGATPMAPSAAPVAPGTPEEPVGEPGMNEPELPDALGNAEDDSLAKSSSFAGREKKAMENRKARGKKIAEDVAPQMPHSHESNNLDANLSNVHIFHSGLGRLADSIRNMIRTEELSLDQRKALASVLSHVGAFAHDPAHWQGVDADKKLQMALQSAGLWKVDSPSVEKIVSQLKRLAHIVAAKHDGMLAENIAMLRKSSDPDSIVLKMFRTKLRENKDSQLAAIRTARAFAIDVEDVVAVVREAAARRPFPLKNKVREDAPALMQGVPMFPVDQHTTASTITKNPLTNEQQKDQSGSMIPSPMQLPGNSAPSASGSATNQPLTPADKRARQNATQQRDAMAKQQAQTQTQAERNAKPYEPPGETEEVMPPPKQRGFMQQRQAGK